MILFSENSWNFFNQYVFTFITDGLFRLFNYIPLNTSNIGNPFAFLDPMIQRSLDPALWKAIIYMLLSFKYTIVALVAIYSLISIFICFFEIVANFIVSFLVICILISIAPFFIMFCLFNYTRSIFNAWVNLILMNSFQPLILVLYVLALDQIMAYFTNAIIPDLCWNMWIPIAFYFDFDWIFLPFGVLYFPLTYIGIPFDGFYSYMPAGTNVFEALGLSLILFICAELSNKAIAFANEISANMFGTSTVTRAKGEVLPENISEDLVRGGFHKTAHNVESYLDRAANEVEGANKSKNKKKRR